MLIAPSVAAGADAGGATSYCACKLRDVYHGAVSQQRPDGRTEDGAAPSRGAARSAADQVAGILSAAEQTAERIRSETETRAGERIAEGERAAQYRITAAEEEAAEILQSARADAERIGREARKSADAALAEAEQAAARSREETERHTRELISEARATAQEVRSEGMELVANMRQMGDSMRANAERILRDVQGVHSHLVARIERVERAARPPSAPARPVTRDRPRSCPRPRAARRRR